MAKRRILIAGLIGILVFALVNLLGDNFWSPINRALLNFESKVAFMKSYSNQDAIFMDFSEVSKDFILNANDENQRKELYFDLIDKVDQLYPNSITLVLSEENKVSIYPNDLLTLQALINTPIQSLTNTDVENQWFDENNKKVLLDPNQSEVKKLSLDDLQNEVLDEDSLRSKNVFVLSPNLNMNNKELNRLINYFENRSVRFFAFPKFLLLLAILGFAALISMMHVPGRFLTLGIVALASYMISQIIYGFFNVYVEFSTLVMSALVLCILMSLSDIDFSNLIDMNALSSMNFLESFVAKKEDKFETINSENQNPFADMDIPRQEAIIESSPAMPVTTEPLSPLEAAMQKPMSEEQALDVIASEPINPAPVPNSMRTPIAQASNLDQRLIEDIRFDLRNKHYGEFETKLEEMALDFEERCHESIYTIQEKLMDLLADNVLSERDNLRLGLIKHNFDHLLAEIDKNLFSQVPLRFEGEEGFINVLEIYAAKIYQQTKSKVQIQITSDVPSINLPMHEKLNIFRVIENIVTMVLRTNYENNKVKPSIEIRLEIKQSANDLSFDIGYKGNSLEDMKQNPKIQDCFRRSSAIRNSDLSFESKLGFNYIKFNLKDRFTANPAMNQELTSQQV